MKVRYTISVIVAVIFLASLYQNLMAFKDGIVGFTKKNGESIGCVCHNLDPNDTISVKITGPATVRTNDTAVYVLSIANGPAITGGCDIAVSRGTIYPSPVDTFLKRAEMFPGSGFELTHKTPKPFTGDTLKFIFTYIAPSVANIVDTIFANGNSTNNDLGSDNDKWNFAENFVISITTTRISDPSEIADAFTLDQNYPNPFNPETNISYVLKRPESVSLRIFDAAGKTVAVLINNEFRGAGKHSVKFDSSPLGLGSGAYFYELKAGGNAVVKKMMLLK